VYDFPPEDVTMSKETVHIPQKPVPDTTRSDYIEQYKAYLADLGNIGTRYATVQGFYVSVITALLGLLALTETSTKLLGKLPTSTLVVVSIFSIVLCFVWSLTIIFYRRLFRAKFTVIRKLEEYLPVNCFELEYTELKVPEAKEDKRLPHLLRVERYVPLVLILFFVALAVIRVVEGGN
jgi:hypothetical protein